MGTSPDLVLSENINFYSVLKGTRGTAYALGDPLARG